MNSLIHVIAPAFRALLLLPLLAGLMSPRVNYSPVLTNDNIEQPTPTDSSSLLPRSEAQSSTSLSTVSGPTEGNSKYGTFHTAPSESESSAPLTQAATPAPSTPEDLEAWNNDCLKFYPTYAVLISSLRMRIRHTRGQKR